VTRGSSFSSYKHSKGMFFAKPKTARGLPFESLRIKLLACISLLVLALVARGVNVVWYCPKAYRLLSSVWQTMYTQLAPYSSQHPHLFLQAAFLLEGLLAGSAHPFPCTCGACVAWAYISRERKTEGRQYSLRRLYIFFLRRELWIASLVEARPKRRPRVKVVQFPSGRKQKRFTCTPHWGESACWAVSWPDQGAYWARWKKAARIARDNDLDARCLAGKVPEPSAKASGAVSNTYYCDGCNLAELEEAHPQEHAKSNPRT